jgi:hypothetical protein
VRIDPRLLSVWLAGTLELHGIRRFGDLEGRVVRDLQRLRRFGPTQLRELHRVLVEQGALDDKQIAEDARAERAQKRATAALVPPYAILRHEPIAIRADARSTVIATLPWPAALRVKLADAGRIRLGDLHGLVFCRVFGADNIPNPPRAAMRLLHGWLTLAGVREPAPPLFDVPRRVREVLLDDVPMPPILRKALRMRRIRTLGDLASLTPVRLGPKFGTVRRAAIEELVRLAPAMRIGKVSYVRGIEAALDRLAPPVRRALLLRFGAKEHPLTTADVAQACRWRTQDPAGVLECHIEDLLDAGGVALRRTLRELRARVGEKLRCLTEDEAERLLFLAPGRLLYAREFYRRLLAPLDVRRRNPIARREHCLLPTPPPKGSSRVTRKRGK